MSPLLTFAPLILIAFIAILLLLTVITMRRLYLKERVLSAKYLQQLPTVVYTKNEENEVCVICYEAFAENDCLRVLPCKHRYHVQCIDAWLLDRSKECPICREKAKPDDINRNYDVYVNVPSIRTPLMSWLKIRKYNNVPGPRPRLPLIGTNWYNFGWNVPLSEVMNVMMKDLYNKFKDDGLCAMFNSESLFVIIFDPKYGVDFLKDSKVNTKSDEYSWLGIWLGNSLITGNGNAWKNKRKLLNPTFHSNILDEYIPSMNTQCNVLVTELAEATKAEFIDVRSILSETTLNIIAMTAMGITLEKGSKETEVYRNCFHTLPTSIMNRILNPLSWYDFTFYHLAAGKKVLKDVEILNKFHRKVIEKRREEFTPGFTASRKQLAFLDLLLTLQAEDKSITDKEILDDVSTFLFAGHDTSSVSLTFTLYLLGKHLNVQEKVIEEMQSIFGDDKQRDVNKDDISRMHYTECVIKESLRLYSPIPQVGRKATDDFSIGPHRFPKGTAVVVYITDMHRSSEAFPNPLEFIPERFENSAQFPSFIPFALGPRNCIGQRFAMIEMKCILAHIFRNFRIKTMNKSDPPKVTADIVQKPIEPINIQFKNI